MVQNGNPVGESQGLLLVMGDVYGGNAQILLQLPNFGPHLDPDFGIQVAQGFVEQKDIRVQDQSPGQGHPLLLSAG